ncbi:MAG: CvpA family protein [bacterium]|nr:CvpA family protein [bacterium]
MNWADLVIAVVLLFFALEGLGKPLLWEFFDLLSLLLAFVFSLKYYNLLSKLLESLFLLPHSLANVLGFVGSWFLIETVLFLLLQVLIRSHRRIIRLPGDTYLSIIPSFFKGTVFVAILLILITAFPVQPAIKNDVQSSYLGSLILSKTYQLEAPLKGVFGGFVNDTLTFLTIRPGSSERVNLGFQTSSYSFDVGAENSMITMVNKERTSRGLPALTFDARLRAIARPHSADMFTRGYFAHNSPEGEDVADRAKVAGINYLVIGENLAFAPSLELAHQGLMNSPGHRANILSEDYHKIGIGIAVSGYGLMITQNFSN